MQATDIAQFTNSPGWFVKHNADTNMYTVRNERGGGLPGSFTDRRFAQKHLSNYLERLQEKKPKKLPPKRAKKTK